MSEGHGGRLDGALWLAAASLVALLLIVSGCAADAADQGWPTRAQPASAQAPALTPKAPDAPPFGFAVGGDFRELPQELRNRELDTAQQSGARWLRVDIDWSAIEPNQGRFDWTATDRVVRAARDRGLMVLGLLTYTPRWAQDSSVGTGDVHSRPASAELFATFARQSAEHYSGLVTAWEIWNEPNIALFFQPRPDVAFYADLLRRSYQAIHAVQPQAVVVGGSLAPAVDTPDGGRIAPAAFITELYKKGGGASMDAVSIHPYSFPDLPGDGRTADYNTFQQIPQVHAVMQRFGDGAKLLWLTEFGAPTASVPGQDRTVVIDDQLQARIIADGLQQAKRLGYIGPVFVYTIRDGKTGDPDLLKNFGIVHSDFSRKASMAVLQQYARDN